MAAAERCGRCSRGDSLSSTGKLGSLPSLENDSSPWSSLGWPKLSPPFTWALLFPAKLIIEPGITVMVIDNFLVLTCPLRKVALL